MSNNKADREAFELAYWEHVKDMYTDEQDLEERKRYLFERTKEGLYRNIVVRGAYVGYQVACAHKDEEIAALKQHNEQLQEKIDCTNCACSYENAGDVCMTHSPVVAALKSEVKHWKNNHAHEVKRARLIKHRLDLPLERLKAYDRCALDKVQALEAKNKQLVEALVEAEEFVDMHSEPWYKSGQALLTKLREALGSQPNEKDE